MNKRYMIIVRTNVTLLVTVFSCVRSHLQQSEKGLLVKGLDNEYQNININIFNKITVTSHELHGVWNHGYQPSLLNSLLKLTSTKTSMPASLAGNQSVAGGFPPKKQVTWKAFPCHGMAMSMCILERYHVQTWSLDMYKHDPKKSACNEAPLWRNITPRHTFNQSTI